MATRFYLSPRPDKQGECPIRCSISIRGTRLISTAGYNIHPDKWNTEDQQVKKGHYNADKVPANIINARIKAIDSHFANFEIALDHRPTQDELAEELAKCKGTTRRKSKRKNNTTALDYFRQFILEESSSNYWSDGTISVMRTTEAHIEDISKDATLEDFDENGLAHFVDVLRNQKKLSDETVQKEFRNLCWFLRWCLRKGYTKEDAATRYKPKFKKNEIPVIYLTKEELMQLYNFEIPSQGTTVKLHNRDGKEYEKQVRHELGMKATRDLFCFCAFTSLRYSDAIALKKQDINGDFIRIVQKKTGKRVDIELNDYSRAILEKYKDANLPNDAAIPYASTKTMDLSLKELGELLGFNDLVTKVIYKDGRRIPITQEKWKMLSSHAGRRTFIVNALSMGIPPQVIMKWTGHSGYQAMKPYIDIVDDTKRKSMEDFNKGLKPQVI